MSSDPTKPIPEWWQQQQDPQKNQGHQEAQDFKGNQGGHQGTPGWQGDQGTQGWQADQNWQGSQETQRLPANQGYQQDQGYQGNPDYQGAQGYQGNQGVPVNQGYPAAQDYQGQGPAPRIRRRRRKWPYITLIVILVVLVVGDRAANAFTEDQMASQFKSSLALSGKPHVTIQGFPFLTQLAARDFNTVNINASNETAGDGVLEIASLTATLHGMHLHGFNSVTIDQFNASALITFAALGKVGGIPQGATLSADGPNKIKADVSLGPLSETAVFQVTKSGPGQIHIQVTDLGGVPSDFLGSFANFNVNIPKLPAGVSIQSVSVTQQGIRVSVTGHNTTLSQ